MKRWTRYSLNDDRVRGYDATRNRGYPRSGRCEEFGFERVNWCLLNNNLPMCRVALTVAGDALWQAQIVLLRKQDGSSKEDE